MCSNARMIPMSQKDQKIYNLHYDDVRRDVLCGTTPAAVKIKYVLNENLLEARHKSKKRK